MSASPPEVGPVPAAAIIVSLPADLRPDLATIDLLAQLQLSARRLGLPLRVEGGSSELKDLLELTGLASVLEMRG